MGHLINPIAFRLGINRSWESTWYIKNIYYPEFLHNVLNLRNFVYYIFTTKDVRDSGIFLSEIKFFKAFKSYIINIYLYHLELEKVSYRFINKLYTNYYKKEYTKDLKIILPSNYWFLHNADLYAFIFVFYNIFFNVTNKFWDSKKKTKFNFKIDNNIKFFINKFNEIILGEVIDKDDFLDYIDFYLKNLINKSKKLIGIIEWNSFMTDMQELGYILRKKFRYNNYKHDLIKSKFKNLFLYTSKLKRWKKKYKIKKKIFFNLIYSYLINDFTTYSTLKKEIKLNKENKNETILNNIYMKNLKKLEEESIKGVFWKEKLITKIVDLDHLLVSSNNIVDNYFLNIFLYLGKKVDFAKFKNYKNFKNKWGYIIKFLKFLDNLEYKNWFQTSSFFLYLSACLYTNLKTLKNGTKFYVRNTIYRIIYFWLGKIFFFPFFKNFTELLYPIFIDLINYQKIKINYFFISVNDVSARFIATYISLKLRKNHYLKSIINPVRKELWRLSRSSIKEKRNYKILIKTMKKKGKKRFIKLLKFVFFYFNQYFLKKIKKYNSIITIDFFLFKLNILDDNNKILLIDKYMKINVFFEFFYGKLQNNFNLDFPISKLRRKINSKNKIHIYLYFISKLNSLNYFNIKKFKLININFFLIFTNIIKYYIDFKFFKNLWNIINNYNRRNLRHDINKYKKSGLIAYKMAFKGRFSRKQRASSIWYANGRYSLNRLDLKVDYSFVKVPLKNSIVSIKIWLFRNPKFKKFKYILNF